MTDSIVTSILTGITFDAEAQTKAQLLAAGYTGVSTQVTANRTFTASCSDGYAIFTIATDGTTFSQLT